MLFWFQIGLFSSSLWGPAQRQMFLMHLKRLLLCLFNPGSCFEGHFPFKGVVFTVMCCEFPLNKGPEIMFQLLLLLTSFFLIFSLSWTQYTLILFVCLISMFLGGWLVPDASADEADRYPCVQLWNHLSSSVTAPSLTLLWLLHPPSPSGFFPFLWTKPVCCEANSCSSAWEKTPNLLQKHQLYLVTNLQVVTAFDPRTVAWKKHV